MLQILSYIVSLGVFVCFVIVVVQMFKHGETTVGIICAVTFCCVGPLIALIYGWINVNKWQIHNLMYIYTGLAVLNIIISIIGTATGAFAPAEIDFDQNF